jgi:putative ABC transport system permease protein
MGMLLRIAWRNIGRGWRRSAVVITAVAVGLLGCLLILGWTKGMFYQMADNAIRIQLAHLTVSAEGYNGNPGTRLNLADYELFAELARGWEGVSASPRLRGEGLVRTARKSVQAMIVGVVPEAEAGVSVIPQLLVEGTFLEPEAAAGRRGRLPPVAIGQAMAERLGVDLGDKVVLQVPGDAGLGAFRVRGLFRTSSSEFDERAAFLRMEDAQRLYELEGRVTEVALALDRAGELPAFQNWLRSSLPTRPGVQPVEVLRWDERAPRLAGMLDIMDETSWIFYGVIFVAMAFGIANAMLMAVFERIREFGVLRSMGLRASHLVLMIALESMLLTLTGTLLGMGIGVPTVLWLGEVGLDLSMFSEALESFGFGTTIYVRLDSSDAVFPIVLALVTGLLASLWPGIKAARLRPAQALRRN